MADPRILETVSRLPHFRALSPELVERVASTCCLRGYTAGETIFSQGEACRGKQGATKAGSALTARGTLALPEELERWKSLLERPADPRLEYGPAVR